MNNIDVETYFAGGFDSFHNAEEYNQPGKSEAEQQFPFHYSQVPELGQTVRFQRQHVFPKKKEIIVTFQLYLTSKVPSDAWGLKIT